MNTVHFYVTLKDDFLEKCRDGEAVSLFNDIEDPYVSARERVTPGRIYPVLGVGEDGRRLTVIDDEGRLWTTMIGLFKFADQE